MKTLQKGWQDIYKTTIRNYLKCFWVAMEFDSNDHRQCWYSEQQANKALSLVTSPQLKTVGIKTVQPLSQRLKIIILLKFTPVLREIWRWSWMVFYCGRCGPVKNIGGTSAVALLPVTACTDPQSLLYHGWTMSEDTALSFNSTAYRR